MANSFRLSVRRRPWLRFLLALLVALVGAGALATVASAAPVYEIDGRWAPGTPDTVAKGDVVTGVWRVNVNDDQPAPANDPVENVTFTVTLEHGQFKTLPDLCRTGGALTPESSLSDDGRTLTCNLGTVVEGTAVVVQAPVVADGVTGDQITATGEIAGQTAELDPIDIENSFGMDMLWGTPTSSVIPAPNGPAGDFNFDFEWTLFQDKGSDAGPDSVTYNLSIPLANGQALGLGQQSNVAPLDQPCVPYRNSNAAEGHPYSGYGSPQQQAPFVDSCTLVKTGPNTFQLTLSGIDYSQTLVPTEDSAGNPLPADQVAIASGAIWLRVSNLTAATSANLTASAPTYTSVTGLTDADDPTNNTSSKVITFPGTWNTHWVSRTGGTPWDNTYKVAPGTLVVAGVTDTIATTGIPAGELVGDCIVLDKAFTDYDSIRLLAWMPGDPVADAPPGLGTIQYYVGNDATVTPGSGGYNPDAFTGCSGGAGWTGAEPADKTTVKAVRIVTSGGELDGRALQLRVRQTVHTDAPIGQDIWTWGGVVRNGNWIYPGRGAFPDNYTPTPGERYNGTNGGRDILHVIFAVPHISKQADRQVIRPGDPATFTLTYSANGSGTIPETVDDYEIVDTLPAGMTYVAGSATPEPTLSASGGQQVLTWVLDDVPTNAANTITYQAVADDSVTPGETLTNTVTSALRGENSRPATAQVTVSSSGYTEISKTADTPFIPNLAGDGDGEGTWTVTLRSFDPLPQAFTDTIDVLPWEGDQRGTAYDGAYSLVSVAPVPGATVYYTTADPATLSDDPAHASNGGPNDPAGNTVGWSTTFTADASAVRVIGPALDPGATQAFKVTIATDGAHGEDLFVNRAQARTGHTELRMRTSSPMAVANYYSAALKKYVQDRDGVWHDAQDVTDYPAFRYGDTVRYRIVVTNTGQGTLTNIEVTDDKQPTLGNFHIDSLAPGASQSHEYAITLDPSTNGTVVNTASATADTPPDSGVPPTIPPDPAGFEVANYHTVKTSDPASGGAVASGDKVSYTVAVTQEGTAPADAEFVDDLSDVLDDARYNHDVAASIGTAIFNNGRILWSGTVPVGGVATVTYSVTVKRIADLGDFHLENVVASPGCEVVAGATPYCTTNHDIAEAAPPAVSGGDGSLPDTGGPDRLLLAAAAAMLLAGVAMVLPRTRRRWQTDPV